jgi:type VI secretion system protein ImpH
MAGESGKSSAALIEQLFRWPDRFAFAEAVRLLEQKRRLDRRRTGRPGSAQMLDPATEFAWYRSAPALTFPTGEIDAIRPAQGDEPLELEVCFLGLNGASGVLPRFYSELVLRELKLKNLALRDFLDIFNDRAIRQHLAASRKYRLPATFELADGNHADPVTAVLRALIGMATAGLDTERSGARPRMAVSDIDLISYAGLLSRRVRSAAGLEQLLCDYLGRPVQVIQMTGRWAQLDSQDQTQLPSPERPAGNYAELGINAVLGTQIFDVQGCFRLRLGPLTYQEFSGLLPGTTLTNQIADLTRFYVGPSLAFEVQLALRRDMVPACVLGDSGELKSRLGLNTWLFTSVRSADAEDVVLRFEHLQ